MPAPKKPSDLPNFLEALEQRKINSFQVLIDLLQCASCHKQALTHFSRDKYFLELEEEPSSSDCLYSLPFEFNDYDNLGPWDILLSEDTIKDLRQLESSPEMIRTVIKKLGQLSLGKWDKHELRRKVQTHAIPVYEIELPDNDSLKILWQVDYGFSIRSKTFTQLVKIWAVTANKEQIHKRLENLLIVHQFYTPKHLCVTRQADKDNVISPKTLGNEEMGSPENGLHSNSLMDERLLGVHNMLVTNKFVTFSWNLYKSIVLGGLNFTFQVSQKEYDIINNPTSAIIIGRSGTGKTTCIVFRQIASYLNSQLCKTPSNDKVFHKRQIFITLSPNLCHRVKEYFNKLLESAMLAGKEISITQLNEYRRKKEEEEADRIDSMFEEGDEDDNIPNSFHKLADHHFPLFITYDKFSKMLRETYGIKNVINQRNLDAADEIDTNENFYQKSSSSIKTTNFVDYNVFRKKYWPCLNCKFDCELVYAEFSIIKGSKPEVNFLSREDYRNISIKKYPVFSFDRDRIYDLFEKYEAKKARNGHYDSIDRTLAILRIAKKKALGGPRIHEVYIDECQDNQIVDLTLILKVFDRVNNIFLAGDIAQCIARGSSFRFEDLHALLYNWERTRVKINHSNIDINPNRFELDINYRSHNGILQLASSVIDLVQHFFPNSIDKLSRERSKVGGPRPILFDGFQKEHLMDCEESELDDDYTHNKQRHVDLDENQFIEFGADQVIIVRDDKAKIQVKKLINKAGLVMTVFEAKGMEFNDVLIYNFFTDSPACRKWRVIDSISSKNSKGVQTFSHEKHYILSSELKNLYVAVTRARQRLWICDENIEYSKPIREHWKNLGLIKIVQSERKIVSNLAKKSGSYEWNQRGKNLFEEQRYEQAIICFEKSGNEERRKLANAYYLQQIAKDSINDSDDDTIKSNFFNAINAFKECSRPGQAALCYQDIGMYKEAGDIYVEHNMFESAARSYLKANMWHGAGEYFEKAEKYDYAALAYKDGFFEDSLFYEIAIKFILKYKQKISKKTYCNIAHHIKLHYHNTAILYGKFEEPVEIYEKLINSYEDIKEIIEFLLYICRFNILNETMVPITDSSTLKQYLSKINEFIVKMESQLIRKSEKWNDLMKEYNLYTAYLDKDINKTYECIQYFRRRKKLTIEFHAINIWLQVPKSNIQAEYWKIRLQNILRLCDLHLFCKRSDCPQKRQICFGNPLVHLINEMHGNNSKKDVTEITNNRYIYNVDTIYETVSKFLASYISELILESNQKGRNIPNISSQICYNFVSYQSCLKQNCQNHHVITTPTILHKRLELAFLQYTVIIKLDVLYRHRLLKEQSIEVRGLQRWWAESLVKFHIRYQSPQISCPEVTCMVLANLSDCTRKEFIEIARKRWLCEFNNNVGNFEIMLKCMFIFQQLKDKWGINTFDWEMSKTTKLLNPNNLPIGFEYRDVHNGYHRAIPVGKRLSLFFHHLKFNHVIEAILNIKVFIQYAISKNQKVNLVTSDAFGDLVSLMEFATSLIFAVSPRCCDFFLPRSYLFNYFDTYSAMPLFPEYNRKDYLTAVKNSFDQVQQLLELLICKEQLYLLVILRLIRLLILIGLNESTFITRIFSLFKYLNNKVSSAKIKKYLKQKSKESVINVLYNDLKETGCDSLIIVYYQLEDIPSKISKWEKYEKYGIIKLTYNSAKDFRSALQQIKSSVVAGGNMHNCPKTQEAARKIQVWFRRVYKRVKFRSDYDTILNEIYNDMTIFCHALMEEKGKKAVSKYNILLKGQTVDIIAELIMLQSKMEVIENRLKKTITDHPSDTDEIDSCLELEDELRYNQYEKVELALKSLSITENSSKYKEANIEWLENELHQAEDSIDRVWECIDECKAEISLFYFTEDFVSKKISKSQNSTSYGDCDDWQ
ncbi:hypothetical protein GLOIN_2v1659127 [Rhizophagus irregularis DAOM 181602=DAOM 197198]|uniref:UvrD-like helicase ATP-binding domain-containing protein n=1 Tax=Rhizophagus irregularis (strain DAOM 181602 / DAOM 197198 / MUCL 43194) TaxID=747089 RepID=A0A2P4PLE1_RHIID|nr:hypothetical protein GLOIN_2v1659127 [Rhizophagus irregularis DAOM 181602=DAOM 197198]POG66195.1 hypothetical protein GLOIN_2v1659127 [Rhizophagus irregularis DAOM 181602=DAOM 197198]|eukprot:XP_025173061.1 hypothetical protein GLOIN_2v1659127 [Rhizophagus irregularis DAOM 181602=DAOM 197198]